MNFYDWKRLRQDAAFQALFRKARTAVKKNQERSCLSHHTTGSCRANEAPIPSLKACGLDDPIASPDDRGKVLHVSMANTFYEGDGKGLEYWSEPFPSSAGRERVKEFKGTACLEILTVLLATQPNIVRMPLKCLRGDPNQLRAEGRIVHQDRLNRWSDPFGAVQTWEALVTDETIHRVSLRGKARALQYYVPGTEDEEIVRVMRSWSTNQQRPYRAHRMPEHRRNYLRAVLPPGGLEDFLARNAATFEHWREEDNTITFKFRSSASGEQDRQQPLMVLDDPEVEPTASSQAATSSQAGMAGVEILGNQAQPAAGASGESWSWANSEGYGRAWSEIPEKKKGSRGVCTDLEGGHLGYQAATDTWAKEPEGDREERRREWKTKELEEKEEWRSKMLAKLRTGLYCPIELLRSGQWVKKADITANHERNLQIDVDLQKKMESEGAFGEPAWTHSTSSGSQSWDRGACTWDGWTWDEGVG